MLNTIVLDACTIINFLRIDDEDGFLMKRLFSMVSAINCAIAEEVLGEARINAKRNKIDIEREAYIDQMLPRLNSYQCLNSKILEKEAMWHYVSTASNHHKKINGELYSAALCLKRSREEGLRSIFFTDDLPAQDEFREIFELQQIGYITDTAHLLIYLFVNSNVNEFPLRKLKEFLFNLRNEYNRDTKMMVDIAEKCREKCNMKRKKDYYIALGQLVSGFYRQNDKIFREGIKYIESKPGEFKELDKLITSVSMANNMEVVQRISKVIESVDKYPIFQKAKV